MSNAINRQEVSDYEQELGAWRRLAENYNAKVGTYNQQAEAFKSAAQAAPYVVGSADSDNGDGYALMSDGSKVKTLDSATGKSYQALPGKYFNGYDGNGSPLFQGKPNLSVPVPDKSSLGPEPKVFSGKPPSLTQQQQADLQKSDTPMADAAKNEASKRSVFKPEQGLVARAMAGFK